MTGPVPASRCWNCGSGQPYAPPVYRNQRCVYCAADLTRPPATGRVRWLAHRPVGLPAPVGKPTTRAYAGPPRYRYLPRWGFPPSIWTVPAATERPVPPPPIRDIRSVLILTTATGVMCVLAAAFEAWRYLLLVRGRTEVLRSGEVRANDALVVAAGWSAVLLAVAVVVAIIPAVGRLESYATRRAGVSPSRPAARRLMRLLIPGWNLYGAGAVLAELDVLLHLPASRPEPPESASLTAPMRWQNRELPTIGEARTARPAASQVVPVFRSPHRLLSWWWLVWAINGVLSAVVAIRTLIPGSLQVKADLVWLHVALGLVGATVAFLTAAVLRRWRQLLEPEVESWPAGWVLAPGSTGGAGSDHPNGSAPAPMPTSESTRSAGVRTTQLAPYWR